MCDLARAIEQDELRLYFQPKARIASGEVCGAESLLRWQHPQHGLLPRGEFIGLAERAGLITPLTHWVLEAAFRQSYTWLEAGVSRPIAVNLLHWICAIRSWSTGSRAGSRHGVYCRR